MQSGSGLCQADFPSNVCSILEWYPLADRYTLHDAQTKWHAYIILLFTVKPGDLAYCVQRTEEVLPIALARPYVEQYVPKQTKV